MYLFKKLFYYGFNIFLLGVLLLVMTQSVQAKVELNFHENQQMKSIVLETGTEINTKNLKPALSYDKERGTFRLELKSISPEYYAGERIRKHSGEFPLRVIIDFVNNEKIALRGKTDSFTDIKTMATQDGNEYKIQILYPKAKFTNKLNNKTSNNKTASNTLFANTNKTQKGQENKKIQNLKNIQSKTGKFDKYFPYIKKFLSGVIILLFLAGGTWLVLKIYKDNSLFNPQQENTSYSSQNSRVVTKGVRSNIETEEKETPEYSEPTQSKQPQNDTHLPTLEEEQIISEEEYVSAGNGEYLEAENNTVEKEEPNSKVENLMEMKKISYQEASLIMKMKGKQKHGREK